jgi:uncharacterized protein (DUF58 family)
MPGCCWCWTLWGDHGVSRGVDGSASTLDVSVRAAAAIAEHLIRQGDRVGLRILGRVGTRIPVSSGYRQLTRVREALVRAVPGVPAEMREGVPPIQVPDGTIVIVLSPMLDNLAVGVAVTLMRRGLPTMVVDTMSGQCPRRWRGPRVRGRARGLAVAPAGARVDARSVGAFGVPGRGVAGAGNAR